MSIEAMKQALEALEDNHEEILHDWSLFEKNKKAIIALRQAIQEEALRNVARLGQEIEQEPWKWFPAPVKTEWGHEMVVADLGIDKDHTVSIYCEREQTAKVESMFATHPPKQWVGLTDDEVIGLMKQFPDSLTQYMTRAIEAKLKEKNA